MMWNKKRGSTSLGPSLLRALSLKGPFPLRGFFFLRPPSLKGPLGPPLKAMTMRPWLCGHGPAPRALHSKVLRAPKGYSCCPNGKPLYFPSCHSHCSDWQYTHISWARRPRPWPCGHGSAAMALRPWPRTARICAHQTSIVVGPMGMVNLVGNLCISVHATAIARAGNMPT
jgi:hypothetical protein